LLKQRVALPTPAMVVEGLNITFKKTCRKCQTSKHNALGFSKYYINRQNITLEKQPEDVRRQSTTLLYYLNLTKRGRISP